MIVEFTEFPLLSLDVVVNSSCRYPRLSRSAVAKIFFISSFEILKVLSSTLIVIKSSIRALVNIEKSVKQLLNDSILSKATLKDD